MRLAPRHWLPASAVAVISAIAVVAPLPAAAASAPPSAGAAFAGYTDKSARKTDGREVVAAGTISVAQGSVPRGAGTTYYVDSQGGDDTATGTTPAHAWRSFANVNGRQFAPGDRILLKAGSVWSASGDQVAREAYDYTSWSGGVPADVTGAKPTALLAPGGSGTAQDPIVLSSYGTGAAPALEGRGVVNDALQLSNQQHWDISDLDVSNVTDGFDATTFQPASGNGQVPGSENPKTGDLRGIHVQAENAGTLSGFDIHHVFVHDVSGVMWSISSSGIDRSKRTGGILFEGLKGDGSTVSQFEDVSVHDSVIANTSFANIVFKQFSGMGTNRYHKVSPGWGDRTVATAGTTGVITEDPQWRPASKIRLYDNYLTNRNTQYGWDSMYLTSVQGATVENNVIDGAGVSGIEMYYADNVVVQNNEVAELEPRAGAADSNAIDADRDTSNILIQGNDAHDSGEGILLCGFGFSTAIVRYNVLQDIARNYVNPHGDSGVNVIYNNLMYNSVTPLKNNTVGFFESSGSTSSILTAKNLHYVLNNVFVNARADVAAAQFRADGVGVTTSNNAYFGPGVSAPAQDARAVTSDPQIGGNPAEGLENIRPQDATSPLIASGKTVDLASIVPGFAVTGAGEQSVLALDGDFLGAGIQTPPDIGPSSYQAEPAHAVVAGTVRDAEGNAIGGAQVSITTPGGSTPSSVRADASGHYVIQTTPGKYALVPSADGYADGSATSLLLKNETTNHRDLVLGAKAG